VLPGTQSIGPINDGVPEHGVSVEKITRKGPANSVVPKEESPHVFRKMNRFPYPAEIVSVP
jgi:hypothetical protein